MPDWSFFCDTFEPEQEGLREALCTLGNGYLCTRGAAPECDADDVHYPGTYMAGTFNRLSTELEGREIENEDLVNLPNWLPLRFCVDGGDWFNLRQVTLLGFHQSLDLQRGILRRDILFRDAEGRETQLNEERLVHMLQPHLAVLHLRLQALNWAGRLTVLSRLDGTVVNGGVKRYARLAKRHLEPVTQGALDEESVLLRMRTSQSGIEVAQAQRTRLWRQGERIPGERTLEEEPGRIGQRICLDVARGDTVMVDKTVTVFSSRDHAISDCGQEAARLLRRTDGFAELARTHAVGWAQLWRRFDIEFELRDKPMAHRTLRVLRLYMFHLLQTTSLNTRDLDAGVPARGLHGEAYRGHIFWDELFIFPLLNLRLPEITRSLLRYRYRRLPEARYAAREQGLRGAMYPWQSGSSGREESQALHLNPQSGRWLDDHSHLQRHVNLAIAYNCWQYYETTGDLQFLSFYGAEMILEIARFFGSLVHYNNGLERYEILGVMGPDEYHEAYPGAETPGLNNNAYTNVMTVWLMRCALKVLQLLPEDRRRDLVELLDLQLTELDLWRDISQRMRVCFHATDIISQFEGYGDLKEFDWAGYRERYGDIQRLDRILEAEGDSTNAYKLSKQADALMLFYLFSVEELTELFQAMGYSFSGEMLRRNVEYYLARTSHGSTLSRVVHSWVLVRSNRAQSWELFLQALDSDVADIQGGTTAEGIHLGAMAGTVDLLARAYTGIATRDGVLWLNPRLPENLTVEKLRLRYRGQTVSLLVTHSTLVVSVDRFNSHTVRVGFNRQVVDIPVGESREFARPSASRAREAQAQSGEA